MKIAVLDSTAVVATGPGSHAFFSRFVLARLEQQGHQVVRAAAFDEDLCSQADLVLCEWADMEAFAAAASGVCKRLVVRMRGFDAHGPLDKLVWQNVSALVYESGFLYDFVEERFSGLIPQGIHHIIPSGIDLARVDYQRRNADATPVVALVARTTADKGYQLAFEYARQTPDVQFHVTTALSEASPRLRAYLDHTCPPNVTIHGTVDTPLWLNEIGATHILSCSIWETLGYTIAEGLAVGCKPLIHEAPGTSTNWPVVMRWTSFEDLDKLLREPFESDDCRAYAEKHFDERKLSQQFIDLVTALPERPVAKLDSYAYRERVLAMVNQARSDRDVDVNAVADIVEQFRARWPLHDRYAEDRYAVACGIAGAYLFHNDTENAAVWACRAMLDAAWPDALCLLGEIADARGDIEEAVAWYEAAVAVPDPPRRFRMPPLVDRRAVRLVELHKQVDALVGGKAHARRIGVPHFAVVVTVRNAERWIERCLESIRVQTWPFTCIVIDDVSTDATGARIDHWHARAADDRFTVVHNTERKWQAQNTVEGARMATSRPDDVVVLVDGDDWLKPRALEVIADKYALGAWMTYGNFETSGGGRSHIGPYPYRVAQAGEFSSWSWQATAPRTFKRFLLDELKDEDFMLDSAWPKVAGDVSVLLPMLEMSCERAVPIVQPIYVYNTETPDSDHKRDAGEQVRTRDRLLERPSKPRLERP